MVISMKKCPICEKGSLHEGIIEEEMFGIKLGKFKAEICDKCNESFIDDEVMGQIEKKAHTTIAFGALVGVYHTDTKGSNCFSGACQRAHATSNTFIFIYNNGHNYSSSKFSNIDGVFLRCH